MTKKLISIVTPCFNEEGNVAELIERVEKVMSSLPYRYEHIFIDNKSTDRTVEIIKSKAAEDLRIKLIVNTRNFGHIRSPYYGLLQGQGDAVVTMASDLQDPPELIPEYIRLWELGFKAVVANKTSSEESSIMFGIRRLYYKLVSRLSEVPLLKDVTGAGLYDQVVIRKLREIEDPYPYFRGLISELGYSIAMVPFRQELRKHGRTKNNFYTLFDMAMLGITNHSKIPLRLMTITGFISSVVCLLIGLYFLAMKLLHWDDFQLGLAPVLIGIFMVGSLQLFFIGLLGEYIGAIYTQVRRRPLVVEAERVNF